MSFLWETWETGVHSGPQMQDFQISGIPQTGFRKPGTHSSWNG
jgi:hypothetical protein